MRRPSGPQTPYEVYCYQCDVTHPLGTRRCMHCGQPIGRAHPIAGHELQPQPEVLAEDGSEMPSLGKRFAGMSLWMILALGAAAYRVCTGE